MTLRLSPTSLPRTLRRALLATTATTALVAMPATTAYATTACHYSADGEWRELDVTYTGTTSAKTAAGTPIAPGTALNPGDKVTATGLSVRATMQDWVAQYGYDAGILQNGSEFAVQGWVALDASNTVEGTTAAIPFTTVARATITFDGGGQVDPERSSVDIDPIAIPDQTWTAAGGDVRVHPAYGDSLPELPVGRANSMTKPEGGLVVKASLDSATTLVIDCLPGTTAVAGRGSGRVQTEDIASAIGATWNTPAYAGALDATPITGTDVAAEIVTAVHPARTKAGASSQLIGAALRLNLTPAQRAAWLGGSDAASSIDGSVTIAAAGATAAQQSVTVQSQTVAGATTIDIPVPATTWTRSADGPADLRPSGPIVLTIAGRPTLTLTPRATGPGVFASVRPSRVVETAPPADDGTPRVSTTNPPSLGDTGTFRPPPAVTKKPDVVTLKGTSLKPSSKQVLSLKLTNPRAVKSRVKVSLRTKSKITVGRKKQYVTIASAKTTTVNGGKTATVKLTLTKAARTLLRSRGSVKVTLTVAPVGSTTTAPVTKTLTLRR